MLSQPKCPPRNVKNSIWPNIWAPGPSPVDTGNEWPSCLNSQALNSESWGLSSLCSAQACDHAAPIRRVLGAPQGLVGDPVQSLQEACWPPLSGPGPCRHRGLRKLSPTQMESSFEPGMCDGCRGWLRIIANGRGGASEMSYQGGDNGLFTGNSNGQCCCL